MFMFLFSIIFFRDNISKRNGILCCALYIVAIAFVENILVLQHLTFCIQISIISVVLGVPKQANKNAAILLPS